MEGKEYNIVGKNLEGKEEKEAVRFLGQQGREGREFLEGELEKTSEELKFIEKTNQYLEQEFEDLNIKKRPIISSEQIHFLPQKVFKKYFPKAYKAEWHAFHNTFLQAAYFNKEKLSKAQLYKALLHESIHISSFHKYYADKENKKVKSYRISYGIDVPNVISFEHFRGLVEAITEKTTLDILIKNKDELIREFDINTQENKDIGVHLRYINMLDNLIKKVVEKKGESEEDVWKRFKKGQFTGEMMHLRDIEGALGKGSLRVIAAWGARIGDLSGEEILEIDKKVAQFIETDDEEEREKIAHQVLIGANREKYKLRGKK